MARNPRKNWSFDPAEFPLAGEPADPARSFGWSAFAGIEHNPVYRMIRFRRSGGWADGPVGRMCITIGLALLSFMTIRISLGVGSAWGISEFIAWIGFALGGVLVCSALSMAEDKKGARNRNVGSVHEIPGPMIRDLSLTGLTPRDGSLAAWGGVVSARRLKRKRAICWLGIYMLGFSLLGNSPGGTPGIGLPSDLLYPMAPVFAALSGGLMLSRYLPEAALPLVLFRLRLDRFRREAAAERNPVAGIGNTAFLWGLVTVNVLLLYLAILAVLEMAWTPFERMAMFGSKGPLFGLETAIRILLAVALGVAAGILRGRFVRARAGEYLDAMDEEFGRILATHAAEAQAVSGLFRLPKRSAVRPPAAEAPHAGAGTPDA